MSRYEVQPPTQGGSIYAVVDTDPRPQRNGSLFIGTPILVTHVAAEAYIFAFSLNAVAAGYSLSWNDDSKGLHGMMYIGPTEGVAP